MASDIPTVGVAGWSKSGKTTLLEALIAELKARGYRVGTVKHSWHPDIEPDTPGRDTWRHARAGSDVSVLAAPNVLATFERVVGDPTLQDALGRVRDVDIVLVEGYKGAAIPKIIVTDGEKPLDALREDFPGEWLAVAWWGEPPRPEAHVPQFAASQVGPMVDLVAKEMGLGPGVSTRMII